MIIEQETTITAETATAAVTVQHFLLNSEFLTPFLNSCLGSCLFVCFAFQSQGSDTPWAKARRILGSLFPCFPLAPHSKPYTVVVDPNIFTVTENGLRGFGLRVGVQDFC